MTATTFHRPRVVAIEASQDVRSLYRALLGDEGYDVLTLPCHEATCTALRAIAPDVVLLDCFLGGDPDGWELLQALSFDTELHQVPVVICATDAHMMGCAPRAALDVGIVVLSKPFDVRELIAAIREAISGSTSPQTG